MSQKESNYLLKTMSQKENNYLFGKIDLAAFL